MSITGVVGIVAVGISSRGKGGSVKKKKKKDGLGFTVGEAQRWRRKWTKKKMREEAKKEEERIKKEAKKWQVKTPDQIAEIIMNTGKTKYGVRKLIVKAIEGERSRIKELEEEIELWEESA